MINWCINTINRSIDKIMWDEVLFNSQNLPQSSTLPVNYKWSLNILNMEAKKIGQNRKSNIGWCLSNGQRSLHAPCVCLLGHCDWPVVICYIGSAVLMTCLRLNSCHMRLLPPLVYSADARFLPVCMWQSQIITAQYNYRHEYLTNHINQWLL